MNVCGGYDFRFALLSIVRLSIAGWPDTVAVTMSLSNPCLCIGLKVFLFSKYTICNDKCTLKKYNYINISRERGALWTQD